MKISFLRALPIFFFLISLDSFGADSKDLKKELLHQSFLGIQKQAEDEIRNAVLPNKPLKIRWVEGVLHESEVFLAQTENSEGYTQYFLAEKTQEGVRLWDLLEDYVPSNGDEWALDGFEPDPRLQACYLDLYVNEDVVEGGVRDYYRFIPGKGVHHVLSCPEYSGRVVQDSQGASMGESIDKKSSTIIPLGKGRLKVDTKIEDGYESFDEDPKVAAQNSYDHITHFAAEYQWDELNQKYGWVDEKFPKKACQSLETGLAFQNSSSWMGESHPRTLSFPGDGTAVLDYAGTMNSPLLQSREPLPPEYKLTVRFKVRWKGLPPDDGPKSWGRWGMFELITAPKLDVLKVGGSQGYPYENMAQVYVGLQFHGKGIRAIFDTRLDKPWGLKNLGPKNPAVQWFVLVISRQKGKLITRLSTDDGQFIFDSTEHDVAIPEEADKHEPVYFVLADHAARDPDLHGAVDPFTMTIGSLCLETASPPGK